jgi:hypothetical protein
MVQGKADGYRRQAARMGRDMVSKPFDAERASCISSTNRSERRLLSVSVLNLRRGAALMSLVALAACSPSGGGGGPLATAVRGGPDTAAATTPVVQGTCPTVGLRDGTAFYRTYAGNDQSDPAQVRYQVSLAETTRQCTLSGSEIVMNVTAAGRIVVGPAGAPGTVQMPIRVAAVRGEEVLYSQLTNFSATVDQGSGQFLFSDTNVRIPAANARGVRVFVGFDEGPYDTP